MGFLFRLINAEMLKNCPSLNSWKAQDIVLIIKFSFLHNHKLRGNYILALALKLDLGGVGE